MTETTEQPTKTTTTIDALLNQVAQGTEFHFQSGLCGNWTLMAKEPGKAAIHLITAGDCWFGFPASKTALTQLHVGDVIFVNQGVSHFISREPVPNDIAEHDIPAFCQPAHQQHGIVCYDIDSPSPTSDTVFKLLPPWVILNQPQQPVDMQAIIRMIQAETTTNGPGSQPIVQRLSDVLAMHLLRAVINTHQQLTGPLAALQDRQLRGLVLAIIDNPASDWSVECMAAKAFLSPSAFAERCHKQTGMAPKKLLDQLRLQRARMLLSRTELSLDLIAEQLGYQSAAAFSRFFKRYAGCSPSQWRQHD